MGKAHLKRLNAPKSWRIKRKGIKFITRPNPGPHSQDKCMPLNLVLRDMLDYASTTKEVKHILYKKGVLVDGKPRKDIKFPVGFMDVVEIPELKEHYRMLIDNKGYLEMKQIDKKEAALKPYKVIKKTMLKGGKIQLNLSFGTNILVKKDSYSTGDTLMLEMPKLEIKEHIKFEKGAYVLLTSGSHIGDHGVVEEIKDEMITFKSSSGKSYKTYKKFAIAIGKGKPAISLINSNE